MFSLFTKEEKAICRRSACLQRKKIPICRCSARLQRKTRKLLEALNAPQMAIVYNQTALVHQDMTKKTTFYEINK